LGKRYPMSYEATYFVFFGGVLLCGVIFVLLDRLSQRRQRRQTSRK
jgi:hypothetical protein